MELVAKDILTEARGLSDIVCMLGVILGIALGLTGWWANRFWVVLAATLTGGLYGLLNGTSYGVQPMVAALGLAIGSGLLALLLVRFVVYAAVAFSFLFLVHIFFPRLDQPALTLLVGGMLGLYLYRLWMMALLSFAGTLLVMYSGLCLLDGLNTLDMLALAEHDADTLNWACISLTAVFVLFQFLLDQRLTKQKSGANNPWAKGPKFGRRAEDAPPPKSWLARGWQQLRRAG
jgi:hypothetical protein